MHAAIARTWRAVTEIVAEATRRSRNARRIRGLCARYAGCSYRRQMDTRRSLVSLLLALSLFGGGCMPSRSADRVSPEAGSSAASDVSSLGADVDASPPTALGIPLEPALQQGAPATVESAERSDQEAAPRHEDVTREPDPRAALGERPRLTREHDESGPYLTVHGFPALRPDGRAILTIAGRDLGGAEMRVLDVDTGEVIDRWPYPAWTDDAGLETVRTLDAPLLRRTTRRIAREGYRALAPLPLVERSEQDGETRWTFALGELRVSARTSAELGDLEITIATPAGVRVLSGEGGNGLDGVTIAPDGSFLVLDESACFCECAEWSRVITLSPGV